MTLAVKGLMMVMMRDLLLHSQRYTCNFDQLSLILHGIFCFTVRHNVDRRSVLIQATTHVVRLTSEK